MEYKKITMQNATNNPDAIKKTSPIFFHAISLFVYGILMPNHNHKYGCDSVKFKLVYFMLNVDKNHFKLTASRSTAES